MPGRHYPRPPDRVLEFLRDRPVLDGDRDMLLLRWLGVVKLREAMRGELDPNDWQQLMLELVDAIGRGEPVAPAYRRAVRRIRE